MVETYIRIYDWMMQCDELRGTKEKVYALIYQMTYCEKTSGWWGGLDHMAQRLNIAKRSCATAVSQLISQEAIRKDYTNGRITLMANPAWAAKQKTIYASKIR